MYNIQKYLLSFQNLFVCLLHLLNQGFFLLDLAANADTVDRCAETLRDTVILSNGSTVDRFKTTVDAKEHNLPDDVRNKDSTNEESYNLTAAGVHGKFLQCDFFQLFMYS